MKQDVLAFLAEMYGPTSRQASPERFRWVFERNVYTGDDPPLIGLWRKNDEILGHVAGVPFDLSVRLGDDPPSTRSRLRMTWVIDYIVREQHRRRGAAALLAMAALDRAPGAVALNLSKKGDEATNRLGFVEVGTVPTYCRPLDAMAVRDQLDVPRWAELAAPVVQPLLRAGGPLTTGVARAAGVRLVPIDRFDRRVDEVWEAAATDYGALAVRDHQALSWRIDERPNRQSLRRYYLQRGTTVLGYVVLRDTLTVRATTVVDYLSPLRWVAPLLTLAAGEAQRRRAGLLMCKTSNPGADRALRLAGFVRLAQGERLPVKLKLYEGHDLPTELFDFRSWFITAADSDLDEPGVMAPGPVDSAPVAP